MELCHLLLAGVLVLNQNARCKTRLAFLLDMNIIFTVLVVDTHQNRIGGTRPAKEGSRLGMFMRH